MEDIRWKQRFSNLTRAYGLLREVTEARTLESLSDLEIEGVIQRFEYTFELMWKTLSDYLTYLGNSPDVISPRSVIKSCAASGLLDEIGADAHTLLFMIDTRNEMSHTYDAKRFHQAYGDIRGLFAPEIGRIYEHLLKKTAE